MGRLRALTTVAGVALALVASGERGQQGLSHDGSGTVAPRTGAPVRAAPRPRAALHGHTGRVRADRPGASRLAAVRSRSELAAERAVLRLLNAERARAHLRPLVAGAGISGIARRHSARMARAGRIWHTRHLAKALRRYRWSLVGENVGVGGSIEALHAGFMGSRSHRRNMLEKRFRYVGVGVVWRGGFAYLTLQFIDQRRKRAS